MKVTRIETLRCDAGWRMFSFLKVMTDDGLDRLVGIQRELGSHGLSGVIEALSPVVIGKDPRDIELINCHLRQPQDGPQHRPEERQRRVSCADRRGRPSSEVYRHERARWRRRPGHQFERRVSTY